MPGGWFLPQRAQRRHRDSQRKAMKKRGVRPFKFHRQGRYWGKRFFEIACRHDDQEDFVGAPARGAPTGSHPVGICIVSVQNAKMSKMATCKGGRTVLPDGNIGRVWCISWRRGAKHPALFLIAGCCATSHRDIPGPHSCQGESPAAVAACDLSACR